MAASHRVFLSHTTRDRRDHALAHALARGLRARGAEVWIAPDSIPPGERWLESLVAGVLVGCTHFVVIVSAASRGAEWVQQEIGLAKARAAADPAFKVLPLEVGAGGDCPHGPYIASLQQLPYHEAFHQQLDALVAAIGMRPRSPVPLPPAAVKPEEFVGREYVFVAIEQFIASHDCGYLVIEGDPGAGKSTLLAEFARRNDAIVHYNVRSLGRNTAQQFLMSVCTQLIARFRLPHHSLPDHATTSGGFLSDLLAEASALLTANQELVIAVDALDEVQSQEAAPGANILFLPPSLPEHVFFVLTSRPIDAPLVTNAPLEACLLSSFAADTQRDVATYVHRAMAQGELARWLTQRGVDQAEFIRTMVERSEGNFMYLRHMLPAVAKGEFAGRALDKLPQGLQQYYQDHWRHMGMAHLPLPVAKIRIVYILAEVQRPISRALISEFASDRELNIDALAVQQVLQEWMQFLHQTDDEVPAYSVYHSSFRDFLHRKDIVQAAGVTLPGIHALIADRLWESLFVEHDADPAT